MDKRVKRPSPVTTHVKRDIHPVRPHCIVAQVQLVLHCGRRQPIKEYIAFTLYLRFELSPDEVVVCQVVFELESVAVVILGAPEAGRGGLKVLGAHDLAKT